MTLAFRRMRVAGAPLPSIWVAMEDMIKWPIASPILARRLSLEPLTPNHAIEMVDVLAAPALYEYTGGQPPSLPELTERYVRQSAGCSPDGAQGWLNWIVRLRESGAAIGFTQATLSHAKVGLVANLAWLVSPRHQGKGYASESARSMGEWLKDRQIAHLVAFISPENRSSAGVARQLGMHRTSAKVDGEFRWET